MAGIERKSFDEPDLRREITHGAIDVLTIGPLTVGRETLHPGWHWLTDVAPHSGTPRCEFHHVGFQLSGRMVFEALDGIQVEMGPGDFYDIAPGHDAWVIGDEPSVQVDFQGVAGWAEAPTAGERTLATILFTDIVGSTVAAERMGNAGWRRLLMQHLEDVQAALARHRGHLVKSTGDGYLATFDSPAHAIAAAEGVALSARTLGIEIRAGVHTGEVELVDDDLGGLAVHLAARIMDAAGPGEVFVSSTVRDLLAGGSIRLAEAGTFELKGISGARILYRVEAAG